MDNLTWVSLLITVLFLFSLEVNFPFKDLVCLPNFKLVKLMGRNINVSMGFRCHWYFQAPVLPRE